MTTRSPTRLFKQTMVLKPYVGSGAHGATYGQQRTVPCRIQNTRELVRDKDGSVVVSETTAYCGPEETVPIGSEVEIEGRRSTVIGSSLHYARSEAVMLKVSIR